MRHFIVGLLLILTWSTPSTGQEIIYFTPSLNNLVILDSQKSWRKYHVTTTEVTGQMQLTQDNPTLQADIDIRHLRFTNDDIDPYYTETVLEASAYPDIKLSITKWQNWPQNGIGERDTVEVTGSGTLTFHGITHPVIIPLTLTSWVNTDRALALSGTYRLQTSAFGITVPKHLESFLETLDIHFHFDGSHTPFGRETTEAYNLWEAASVLANDMEFQAITPDLVLLACIQSEDPMLQKRYNQLEVNLENIRTNLTERLQQANRIPRDKNQTLWDTRLPLWYQSHWEAYQLKRDRITSEYVLMAALNKVEDDVKNMVAQHGLSHERLQAIFKASPKPASEVQLIGNPFFVARKDSIPLRYARNVWDIQVWHNKLYLGHGNSSNEGPAVNAGPIPIISYDLNTGQFATEFTVDEEQIDKYRIVDGRLMVPGHDPRDPWELGNFYRLMDNGWQKVRTIPLGIHAYDILGYDNHIFAAEGSTMGAMVSRSADGGQTWDSFVLPDISRAYELFVLNETVYASCYNGIIYRYTGKSFERARVELFPDTKHGLNSMLVRSVPFNQNILYLGADNSNDHQWIPFAAFKASRIDGAQRLSLPPNDRPYDILVQNETAYILTNRFNKITGKITAIVYQSTDLTDWAETTRFEVPSIARSFEYMDGQFYVGLGTTKSDLNEASGNLYRVTP